MLKAQPVTPRAAVSAFDNAACELAIRLLAWTQFRPEAREVDVLMTELAQSARKGHWETTQGNAWAVLALAAYRAQVERGRWPPRWKKCIIRNASDWLKA